MWKVGKTEFGLISPSKKKIKCGRWGRLSFTSCWAVVSLVCLDAAFLPLAMVGALSAS